MGNSIIWPAGLNCASNVRKQIKEIEGNGNYRQLIPRINEYLRFIATTPTDIQRARDNGYRIEKLTTGRRGNSVYSIRVSGPDRITYEVDSTGNATVIGILGHYKGTEFCSIEFPNYLFLFDESAEFFKGNISFSEMRGQISGEIQVIPTLNDNSREALLSLRERALGGNITPDSIDGLEFSSNNAELYFSREDVLEVPEEKEKNSTEGITQNK